MQTLKTPTVASAAPFAAPAELPEEIFLIRRKRGGLLTRLSSRGLCIQAGALVGVSLGGRQALAGPPAGFLDCREAGWRVGFLNTFAPSGLIEVLLRDFLKQ